MAQPIIEIKGLKKRYGDGASSVLALQDIDLEIEKGDIYGIIGLSGAGKSTLVRCINMLERPTDGSVIFSGTDLAKLSEKELRSHRRQIGMIFQRFNLLMQRTALENITFPLELEGVSKAEAKKRALELLKIVGLEDRADAYPVQLSGGQMQRIAIARAVVNNPKVLLCDEATSALDPNTTRAILDLIKDINRKMGVTVVIITHEMKVIEQICNKVAVIDSSRIIEKGDVKEVFTNPKSDIAKELILPRGTERELLRSEGIHGENILRLVFDGAKTYEPLIASIAIDLGVKASILTADMRQIDDKSYGSMLISVINHEDISKIEDYISGLDGIYVEEVNA